MVAFHSDFGTSIRLFYYGTCRDDDLRTPAPAEILLSEARQKTFLCDPGTIVREYLSRWDADPFSRTPSRDGGDKVVLGHELHAYQFWLESGPRDYRHHRGLLFPIQIRTIPIEARPRR